MQPLIRLFLLLLLILPWASTFGADEPLDLSVGTVVEEGVGMDWAWPEGGFVHLRVIDQKFHLLFLDADRKIIEPPYNKIILRGEEAQNKTNEIVLGLTRGAGPFLTHSRRQFLPVDDWLRAVVPSDLTPKGEAIVLPRQRFRQ